MVCELCNQFIHGSLNPEVLFLTRDGGLGEVVSGNRAGLYDQSGLPACPQYALSTMAGIVTLFSGQIRIRLMWGPFPCGIAFVGLGVGSE